MSYLLGIDLGGTKSAACVGTSTGQIFVRKSGPTPVGAGPEAIADFLIELARTAMAEADEEVIGIGISAGAPADAAQGLVFAAPNMSDWGDDGFPLADAISSALGGLPTALENDADATALAEHRFGAGQNTQNMVFMTVGTGIGGGLILNGQLCRGADGAGGEVGHIAVVPDGRACKCGMYGCLEAYASGPSIVRIAVENGFTGNPTGPEVITAARNGDQPAKFAVEQAARLLGQGIASLCMIVNPECIVLGTLAVHAGDLILPIVKQEVEKRTWTRLHRNLRIVPAALGDRAQDLAALCAYLHRYPNLR